MCGFLERLRYAVVGGLTGYVLSRLLQLLPCCATVVNTDSDRHMVRWNLSLHCSGGDLLGTQLPPVVIAQAIFYG